MLVRGILNPAVRSLLARTRHTNTLVIADRGFPFWPTLETIDLSLIDGIPSVPQVVEAVLMNWKAAHVFIAEEFYSANDEATQERFRALLRDIPCTAEPHVALKRRVPQALGLIRTGETTQYANLIFESG